MLWLQLFGSANQPFDFTDLDYYRAALRVVVAQHPLYAALPYPPVAVLVIAWLGGLSTILGNQLWTAMSMLLALALSLVLVKRSMQARTPDAPLNPWELVIRFSVVGVLLLASMPMTSQLTNGQVTLVIIALTFFDVAQVLPKRFQGVLVGIAGAIKLTPLIFVPYYLVTGQRRQAAVATGSFAATTALGFAMFPSDSLFFWAHLGKSDQFGDPARPDNLSIHSMLVRWLPDIGQSTASWALLGLIVAGLALWRARRHFQRGEVMASMLTVGASAVVLAPIAWPHYHVWVMLAGLWLLMSKRSLSLILGAGIVGAYSMQYTMVVFTAIDAGNRLFLPGVDLLVVIPILIGVFGLPGAQPKAPVADPAAAEPAAAVADAEAAHEPSAEAK